MDREWYKKLPPATTLAVFLVGALILPSILDPDKSLLTKYILQSGWCGIGDDRCLLKYYAYISFGVILVALGIDAILKWPHTRKTSNRDAKKVPTEKEVTSKTFPIESLEQQAILDRFSFHLDELIDELHKEPYFKMSGLGWDFLRRIKKNPPFLGINPQQVEPTISPDLERTLAGFFDAMEFKDKYDQFIRGGSSYRIERTDTSWASVSKRIYGSEKFSNRLTADITSKPPVGTFIRAPLVDISETLGFSSKFIEKRYSILNSDSVMQAIRSLTNDYFLRDEEETVLLMSATYQAAERTRAIQDTARAEERTSTATAIETGAGNAIAVRDNYGTITIAQKAENKQPTQVMVNEDWSGVSFEPWNPLSSPTVRCGLKVTNRTGQTIDDCYAELIEIYEEVEGQFKPCYEERQAELPCFLAWEISNESVYEKIEIENAKSRNIGITYGVWGIDDITFYSIKGKNFSYGWPNKDTAMAELELSGKINGESLKPKRLFVRMLRQNNKFTALEIRGELPSK